MDPATLVQFVSEVTSLMLALERFILLSERLYPHLSEEIRRARAPGRPASDK